MLFDRFTAKLRDRTDSQEYALAGSVPQNHVQDRIENSKVSKKVFLLIGEREATVPSSTPLKNFHQSITKF